MRQSWRESKLYKRLAGPGLFNWELFWSSYLILFIPQILFDLAGFDAWNWLWLPIWTFSHLFIALVAISIRALGLDSFLTRRPSAEVNLAVAAILGIIRVVVIGLLSFSFGLVDFFDPIARVAAGLILGLTVFAFLTNILESSRDFRNDYAKLRATETQLRNLAKSTAKNIKSSEMALVESVKTSAEPKLLRALELLNDQDTSNATRRSIRKELTDLLEHEVRPLTLSLRSQQPKRKDTEKFSRVNRAELFRFPKLVRPELALSTLFIAISQLAAVPFFFYVFAGEEWIQLSFALALLNTGLHHIWVLILRKRPSVPFRIAIFELVVFALAISIIDTLIASIAGLGPRLSAVFFLSQFLFISLQLAGQGLVAAYEFNQKDFLKKIERNNAKIERELALLNQRVWVERRQRALIIHGSVQASLTAAVARLAKPGELSNSELKAVKEHISQARKGLSLGRALPFDFEKAMRNLRTTWSGIVDLKVKNQSDSAKLLISDKWAAICANEIIKEAISNAFRHGNATKATVSFEPAGSGFVDIAIEDNGRGVSRKRMPGLGSQLLDEISHPWSLTTTSSGTVLKARVPVSKRR